MDSEFISTSEADPFLRHSLECLPASSFLLPFLLISYRSLDTWGLNTVTMCWAALCVCASACICHRWFGMDIISHLGMLLESRCTCSHSVLFPWYHMSNRPYLTCDSTTTRRRKSLSKNTSRSNCARSNAACLWWWTTTKWAIRSGRQVQGYTSRSAFYLNFLYIFFQ